MAGTSFENRRGTAAQWRTANPVLKDGELGIEKDTGVVKAGDGVNNWNALPAILGSTYLPILGKAADADKLDGLDSTAFLQKTEATQTYLPLTTAASTYQRQDSFSAALLANAPVKRDANNAFAASQITGLTSPTQDDSAANRKFVNDLVLPAGVNRALVYHFGTLTVFPTTVNQLKVGDRCWRSDLFCEFYWNGGVWRQVFPARMTSAQRVALTTASKADLYDGFLLYETDTFMERRWDNTYWEIARYTGPRSGTGNAASAAGAGIGMGTSPGMALYWGGAVIANSTDTNYSNWTTVHDHATNFNNAGEPSIANKLFSYINTPGVGFRCNARGRVRIQSIAWSDSGSAGKSTVKIITNGAASGVASDMLDTRHRNSGYGGSGYLDQLIDVTYPVYPGDRFGIMVNQVNAANASLTYSNILQAMYI